MTETKSNIEPAIIEVPGKPDTPCIGVVIRDLPGDYCPFDTQNVRDYPSASYKGKVLYKVSGGTTIRISGVALVYPELSQWLVVDRCPPHCSDYDLEYIAYKIGDKVYGSFIYD